MNIITSQVSLYTYYKAPLLEIFEKNFFFTPVSGVSLVLHREPFD